jgi:hypothetical protein
MTRHTVYAAGAAMLLSLVMAHTAAAQLMSACAENSAERRGETGCSIIESKVLPDAIEEPVFWAYRSIDLTTIRVWKGTATHVVQTGASACHAHPPCSNHREI